MKAGIGPDGRYHAWRDPFVVYMLGLAALIPAAVIVFFVVGSTAAWLVGTGGTVVWLIGSVLYIGVRDPEGRWPNASVGARLANLFTFKR